MPTGRTPRHDARCLLLLLLLLPALFFCLTPHARAEQLPVKTYSIADGLAHDTIGWIVQDSRGFLWFCTIDGLSRFDGYHFVTYGRRHGLPSPYVSHLLETRGGDYWVATNQGVARLAPSGGGALFTTYRLGDDPQSNLVTSVQEDRAGHIWATTNGGLFRLERGDPAGSFARVRLGIAARADEVLEVSTAVETADGSIWLGTYQGLVRVLPEGRSVHYPLRTAGQVDPVYALLVDRAGRLWAGGQRGLLVFTPGPATASARDDMFAAVADPAVAGGRAGRDGGGAPAAWGALWYTAADGLAHNTVNALYQSADGRVFVGTRGGLSVYDGTGFRNYGAAHGLSDRIGAFAEDRDRNIWVGTQTAGAMKIARNGLVTYREADGLGHPEIMSLFTGPGGELMAVGGKWSISRLEADGRFTTVRPKLPRPLLDSTSGRWAVLRDHLGEWWAATNQGLYRFPAVTRLEDLARVPPKAVYTTRDGMADNYVSRLFEDSRGDVWISSFNPPVMLTRFERATGRFHRYGEGDGLPVDNWANVFGEDAAGHLWIGLHNGGLARLRGGRFELYGPDDGVPAGLSQGLYFDGRGRLWLALRGEGTGRVDEPTAERPRAAPFAPAAAFASLNMRCFAEDEWGGVYVGTARGVDRLDPATGRVRHFTTADGLAQSEVTAALRAPDGALWFGTRDGLSRLAPEPERPPLAPPVLIAGMRAGGVPRPVSELGERELAGLEFGPGENQIDIDFFGLGFAAGEELRYQYMFEGADADWSAPTSQRTIAANLAPGSYRFLVRAVNAGGAVSPQSAAVSFRVLRPVWQRWWFVSLAALAVAAAAYALYRYRVAQLLKVERVRTRIATDLHDDIGASLSRMAILSEVVKHQHAVRSAGDAANGNGGGGGGGGDDPSAGLLNEIADSARGLVDSMSDIVWSIDPRRDDLNNVAARVRQFASDVLEAKGIRWHLIVPPEVETLKLDPEQRRHLFLIFKEGVNNIARHAEGTRNVWLSITLEGGHISGEIRDDGAGFTPPPAGEPHRGGGRTRGGNGLPNMRARAEQLGGRLDIDSAPGEGTRLSLRLPLK